MDTRPLLTERTVPVWGGRITLHVKVMGTGSPVLYLHPASGLSVDAFLTRLAEHHTVYAPEVPGTSTGDPYAIHRVDDLHDLVLAYEEAIRDLGSSEPLAAIGQSFGGMLAAELAAHFPDLFGKLILLAPIGLWDADYPVANWIEAGPAELPQLLFYDADSETARAYLAPPEDPELAIEEQSRRVWAVGCTGKFVWPIPERGLRKRLHRIRTQTLIVWGADDRLNPAQYAHDFQAAIRGSRVEVIPECGHALQVERTEAALSLVQGFLGE